jgi:hypothetical protein
MSTGAARAIAFRAAGEFTASSDSSAWKRSAFGQVPSSF